MHIIQIWAFLRCWSSTPRPAAPIGDTTANCTSRVGENNQAVPSHWAGGGCRRAGSGSLASPTCAIGQQTESEEEWDDSHPKARVVLELLYVGLMLSSRPDGHLDEAHQRIKCHCRHNERPLRRRLSDIMTEANNESVTSFYREHIVSLSWSQSKFQPEINRK